MENFKLLLDYADSQGNKIEKEQTIKVNKIKDIGDKETYWNKNKANKKYSLSFSLKIPDEIYNFLLGKTVPDTFSSKNQPFTYTKDFCKTINRSNLEVLTTTWAKIIGDYIFLKKLENANLQKVIFYSIKNSIAKNQTSYQTGSKMGTKTKIEYQYFLGYITDNGKNYFDENKKLFYKEKDGLNDYKYVEYSVEREIFFGGIQDSFDIIINKLNEFYNTINEDTIEQIINSDLKLIN